MNILVFGSTGQLASELKRAAPEARFLSREDADLTDPEACAQAVKTHKPDTVIIAAAWTAVDKAEEEEETAQIVNADAPAAIAKACKDIDAVLVHVSTDYVFDGTGERPHTPDDVTNPLGAYGRTKLAGEKAITASGATYAVLRTSWVFSAHGNNFVKTMLRLAESRDRLTIVADQVGGPTAAAPIAHACLAAAKSLREDPDKSGIYHFSGTPDVSWADFAREIFAQAGKQVEVADIPTSEFPTPAPRPANSRLNCDNTERAFGIPRPDWRSDLADVLKQL